MMNFEKNRQYLKFCAYGFLKNLRFYDAFLLLYFIDSGLSFSQVGVLYAAREIVINVCEIPSGLVADLYGRKRALLASFVFYILCFIVFYCSSNFSLLLTAMVLFGVADAFRSGTHKGMIMDYLKIQGWEKHKISYYGHTRSWSQKGSAVSALLAGVMVFFSGDYKIIYLCSIAPYLFNFINVFTYPNELNYPRKRKAKKIPAVRSVLAHLFATLKKPYVLTLVNSAALHSAFLKSIKDYIQPIMVNLAIVLPILGAIELKSKSGLVVGVIYFFIFLLTSYAAKNAGRLSALNLINIEKKTLLLGLFFGGLAGLLFHYSFAILSLLIFIAVYIVENLRKPILTGFLANNVPDEILTSVISVQSSYQTFTTALLSVLIGALADQFGVGIGLLLISATLLVLTALLDGRYKRTATYPTSV